MQLRLVVRTVAGREAAVDADAEDTVDQLQVALERIHGMPVHLQVLLLTNAGGAHWQDGQMAPGRKLGDYGLSMDDEVLLVRELPERPRCQPPAIALCPEDFGIDNKRGCAGDKKSVAKPGDKNSPSIHKRPLTTRPLPPRPTCAPPRLSSVESPSPQKPAQERCVVEMQVVMPDACSYMKPSTLVKPVPVSVQTVQPAPVPSVAGGEPPAQLSAVSRGDPVHDSLSARTSQQVRPPLLREDTPTTPPIDAGTSASGPPLPMKKPVQSIQDDFTKASAPQLPPTWAQGSSHGPRAPTPTSIASESTATGVLCTPAASTRTITLSPGPCGTRIPSTTSLSWSPPGSAGAAPPTPTTGAQTSPPVSARVAMPAAHSAGGMAMPASIGTSSSRDPFPATGVSCSSTPFSRIRRADLQRIGRLGVGAFGVVTLEADRRTGRTYALKAVSKGYLAQLRMEYSVLNEKRILKMVDSPFVVRLLATYNGREHVYFLLEAALGGELFTTYERLQLYGSERHARFYVACVTEALAHLHERLVIYRDLKPENLLLDARGYCKLTDMGLAKVAQGQTYTLVGTPDYMAPEVIQCTGHGRSVDWWMLGVLLYELLAGRAPFEADTTQQVYELVKRGIEAVRFPEVCRRMAADLVRALCRQNPEARLRTPVLRDHAFFRGFDWNALRVLRLTAPHIPQVRGPRDLANFRSCDGEDPPVTPYQDTGSGWDTGFEDDALGSASARAAPAGVVLAAAGLEACRSAAGLGNRVAAAGEAASEPERPVRAPAVRCK